MATPRLPSCWDAVAQLDGGECLLVEAKAQLGELRADCRAVAPSRDQIAAALTAVRADLGAAADADWLTRVYQAANRLACLWFLDGQGVPARTLALYFVGDRRAPSTEAGWRPALAAQAARLGLPAHHRLADRQHTLIVPVAPLPTPARPAAAPGRLPRRR